MELSVEKDREKVKKETKGKRGRASCKNKRILSPAFTRTNKRRGPRALVCLYNIAKKRLYSEREKGRCSVGGGRDEYSWQRNRTKGERGSERKEKGTGDPFRFYTTVNSNCTRWLMAFPFSPLFAKIPSYTSLISHSHANEDRSCNDILRWETPAKRWSGLCLPGGWVVVVEGGRVAYNRFFFLEMSRKMRVPCDSGVKRGADQKVKCNFWMDFCAEK